MQAGQLAMRVHAHSHAVYDVSWGQNGVFATCSADGSARIVDTRCALRFASTVSWDLRLAL